MGEQTIFPTIFLKQKFGTLSCQECGYTCMCTVQPAYEVSCLPGVDVRVLDDVCTDTMNTSQVLKPGEKIQLEMLVSGLADLLTKVAGDSGEAVFCLPGGENCFEPTALYAIDGITEKLHLFRYKKEEELKVQIKRYSAMLMEPNGLGLISLLYSVILSRTVDRLKADMQDQSTNSLVDPMGEATLPLLNLLITGKASPYLHNGIISVGDEYDEGEDRIGIESRNDIGLLLFDTNDEVTASFNLGSRLKTPVLPIWITRCNGKVGVLFNPNRELMRSYQAENRFQLYYWSDPEQKKDGGVRQETILTVDTRGLKTNGGVDPSDTEFEEVPVPPLEKALQTKWEDCDVDWMGVQPYV